MGVTYQNLCEKGTKPMEKELAQSGLPFLRKVQKTTRKKQFSGKCIIWVFFWDFCLKTGKSSVSEFSIQFSKKSVCSRFSKITKY